MDFYSYIKIIHTISAAFLFGASGMVFSYCLWTYAQKDATALASALCITLKINISVIGGCGLLQLITGFTLIYLRATHFSTDWIVSVLSAYSIATLCWLSGIHLLGHCYQTLKSGSETCIFSIEDIQKPFLFWIMLCVIAIACMLMVFNFMTIPGLP